MSDDDAPTRPRWTYIFPAADAADQAVDALLEAHSRVAGADGTAVPYRLPCGHEMPPPEELHAGQDHTCAVCGHVARVVGLEEA